MPDFRKFKRLRIDLESIYGYETSISGTREKGYHDTLYFYPKTGRRESIYVYYDAALDVKLFEEAIRMLDDHFSIKSDAEDKLLP